MKVTTVEKILIEFDPKKDNLLPALRGISAAFGYVSKNDAEKVADYFSLPLSEVFETASFYSLIRTKKEPAIAIKVCSGTNCTVQGAARIVEEIERYFGIRAGDEFNQKVNLEVISCLGRCGEGPIVTINGSVYTKVTISNVRDILETTC